MDWLRTIHSLVRWLVVAGTLVSLVYFILIWVKRLTTSENTDRMLMAIFSGLIDLQVLVGIIYLLVTAGDVGWPRFRLEHAVIMIVAAVIGHLPMRWRKAEIPRETKARNNLLVIVVVLALVVVGISLLPYNGWRIG
jgi:hypothetical protein